MLLASSGYRLGTAKRPAMHRILPHNKELSGPNVNRVKTEKLVINKKINLSMISGLNRKAGLLKFLEGNQKKDSHNGGW